MLNHPPLLLADEPTTALDVTVQSRDLIRVQRRPLTVDAEGKQVLTRAKLIDRKKFAERPLPNGNAKITLSVKEEDLADVMERIGREVGRNILVDPGVNEVVRVSPRGSENVISSPEPYGSFVSSRTSSSRPSASKTTRKPRGRFVSSARATASQVVN